MTPRDVADAILLLGPGFVLLKAFALTGGQHQRLQWEWVVWSVLLSVPVAAATGWFAQWLGIPLLFDWEPALRFVIAAVIGIAAGTVWIFVRRSRWGWVRAVYRSVIDSAWDLALDDATRPAPTDGRYGVEVTVDRGGTETYYYGTLSAFGYERAKAEPWVYLTYPERWEGDERGFEPLERTEGVLLHRDQIRRLRVIQPVAPEAASDKELVA